MGVDEKLARALPAIMPEWEGELRSTLALMNEVQLTDCLILGEAMLQDYEIWMGISLTRTQPLMPKS